MTLCVFLKKTSDIQFLYTIFNFKPEAVVFCLVPCLRVRKGDVEVNTRTTVEGSLQCMSTSGSVRTAEPQLEVFDRGIAEFKNIDDRS